MCSEDVVYKSERGSPPSQIINSPQSRPDRTHHTLPSDHQKSSHMLFYTLGMCRVQHGYAQFPACIRQILYLVYGTARGSSCGPQGSLLEENKWSPLMRENLTYASKGDSYSINAYVTEITLQELLCVGAA